MSITPNSLFDVHVYSELKNTRNKSILFVF